MNWVHPKYNAPATTTAAAIPIKGFLPTPLDAAGRFAPPKVKEEFEAVEAVDSVTTESAGCTTVVLDGTDIVGADGSISCEGAMGARAGAVAAALPKPGFDGTE